jgi:hypothetical protein
MISIVFDYFTEINTEKFRSKSPINSALCKSRTRFYTLTFISQIPGTYFDWLPIELIEMILESLRQQMDFLEVDYYNKYFSASQTDRFIIRSIRASPLERMNKKKGKFLANVEKIDTEQGPIYMKHILKVNGSENCEKDMVTCLDMGVSSVKGMNNFYHKIKKWFIWMCDHSYICKWFNLVKTIIKKTADFNKQLYAIEVGAIESSSPDLMRKSSEIKEIRRILELVEYFIVTYTPYAILSRSDNYFNAAKKMGVKYQEILYEIRMNGGYNPSNFDIDAVYNFELSTYASEYYLNVYQKYKVLRNGKVLSPKGKKPMFYWLGDTYVHRFV